VTSMEHRRRHRARARSAPGGIQRDSCDPLEAAGIESPSATLILEAFRARFTNACDAGVWKRLSNAVLEPANPFDVKARRLAKQETVILGALVFTAVVLAVCFNLSAMAR
jgi:hypothetical protein